MNIESSIDEEVMILNGIKNKLYFYFFLLDLVVLRLILIMYENIKLRTILSNNFYFFIFVFIILIVIIFKQYNLYKIANLILENSILSIEIAESEELKFKAYVSCFGILIGSELIKYNIDGIALKEIEIDDKYLYIRFGKGNKIEVFKLLYGEINNEELYKFTNKIKYETGIIPKLRHLASLVKFKIADKNF